MKEKNDENLQAAKKKVEELAEVAGKGLKEGGKVAGKKIKAGSKFLGKKLKEGRDFAKEFTEEAKLEAERLKLRPVFQYDLMLPASKSDHEASPIELKKYKMIFIVEKDKKRSESPVCQGSIGHLTTAKDMKILNLYPERLDQLDYKFHPHAAHTIYYADPYRENFYISLDEYFDYLHKARVNELEAVAQKLGAKRVQISFKEQKKKFVSVKGDVKGNAKLVGKKPIVEGAVHHEHETKDYASVEIAADVKFSGNEKPSEPQLVYFKGVSDIEKLIKMRMDNGDNKIESKVYKFQCSKLSGISLSEATQIDAALKVMKIEGTATVESEVQKEGRTDLEYSIEF